MILPSSACRMWFPASLLAVVVAVPSPAQDRLIVQTVGSTHLSFQAEDFHRNEGTYKSNGIDPAWEWVDVAGGGLPAGSEADGGMAMRSSMLGPWLFHDGRLTYLVRFAQPGTYRLYMRYSFFDVKDNTNYGNEDSVVIPVDVAEFGSTPTYEYFLPGFSNDPTNGFFEGTNFVWNNSGVDYVITANDVGITHTIFMDTREGGFTMDRIVLHPDPTLSINGGSDGSDSNGESKALDTLAESLSFGPVGQTLCSPANLNSSGAAATLTVLGSTTAKLGLLRLEARSLPPGQLGYFLVSSRTAFKPFPGGSQGNLCLGGKIGRFVRQVGLSDSAGHLSIDVDTTSLPTVGLGIGTGDTWYFQAWFLDQNPTSTSNFTDSVGVTFL